MRGHRQKNKKTMGYPAVVAVALALTGFFVLAVLLYLLMHPSHSLSPITPSGTTVATPPPPKGNYPGVYARKLEHSSSHFIFHKKNTCSLVCSLITSAERYPHPLALTYNPGTTSLTTIMYVPLPNWNVHVPPWKSPME